MKQKTILGLLITIFLISGIMKFIYFSETQKTMLNYGFPDWFNILIGLIEIISAIALWFKKARFYGLISLLIIMLGATIIHLIHQEIIIILTLILAVMIFVIAIKNSPYWLKRIIPVIDLNHNY